MEKLSSLIKPFPELNFTIKLADLNGRELELADKSSKFINSAISLAIEQQKHKSEEIFKAAILKNAMPLIKGEITKGKLIWRGIYVRNDEDGTQWIEQRGVQISDKVEIPKIHIGI